LIFDIAYLFVIKLVHAVHHNDAADDGDNNKAVRLLQLKSYRRCNKMSRKNLSGYVRHMAII